MNSEETGNAAVLGRDEPTVENFRKALQRLYADNADEIFKLYPASTEAEVMEAARDLAGDRFIGYSTWKRVDVAAKTGGKPVYYYFTPARVRRCGRRWATRRRGSPAGRARTQATAIRGRRRAARSIPPRSSTRWATSIEQGLRLDAGGL